MTRQTAVGISPLLQTQQSVSTPTLTNTMVEVASDEDDEHDNGLLVYTANEIMKIGLLLVGFTRRRLRRAKKKTNLDRFRGHFGSNPHVLAEILEDLQTTEVEEAHVPSEELNIKHFLMAMHHLKRYPTEIEREPIFDISHMSGRDSCWFYIEKVQALKAQKIYWPEDNFGDDIWVITVDGTHCWVQEPQHPSWSQDREYYSHKYNKAGLNYELGISLWQSRLVWMKGPTKAGANDLSVFLGEGLKAKLKATGKKGIGDGGYRGHPSELSTPNSHDSKEANKFKSRALKRHEKFNGLTKIFDCLSGRFRHSVDRFKNCFEAVCVICQYQMENGSPLYDILIDDMS
jgi:hypothetical protein